jgi:hypothetical protein
LFVLYGNYLGMVITLHTAAGARLNKMQTAS